MAKFTRKDFLGALFQDYFRKREGFIMVKSSRHLDPRTSVRYFPNIEILAKEPYQADQQVFFGICPHENMRPDRNSIQYLVALWAGLDLSPEGYSGRQVHFFGHSQAAKAIRSFPFPPSIIVESGWGVHLYWLLRDVTRITDVEAVERLLRKINSYFQCQTAVGVDSMLRLPDTVNGKVSGHLAECRVKYINPDFRYDFQEMGQLSLGPKVAPVKGAVILSALSGGTPDLEMIEAAELEVAPVGVKSGGIRARDEAAPASPVADRAEGAPSPSRFTPGRGAAEPKSVGSYEPGPAFEPVPYEWEPRAPKLAVSQHVPSADMVREEVLDRVAEKLADKIAEKVAQKVVDQIVDKVVERLITPG
jgi:hypothetical protein